MQNIKICHLYPDILNLYGDRGNILCLKYRLEKRNIPVQIDEVSIGQELHASDYDFFFIGGGQDFEQEVLLNDLKGNKESEIKSAVEDGKTFLAICGGYQMLGNYYETWDGQKCDFIGAVDLYTIGKKERIIGNYVFTCSELNNLKIVGFENHSGRTYLGSGVLPIGKVLYGKGNNGVDGQEGARYRNVFGTYSHGCLLPKNPVFCDYLITTALCRKYGASELAPLDDTLEITAHDALIQRFLQS